MFDANRIEWSLEAEQSDMNVFEEFDDVETAQKIAKELEYNVWAWCDVKLTGKYMGLTAHAYLSACNYSNESEFMADECYRDLKAEVESDLRGQVESIVRAHQTVGTQEVAL
jgi:hypothetical protein